jgi:hypothetical protein
MNSIILLLESTKDNIAIRKSAVSAVGCFAERGMFYYPSARF